MALMVLGLLLLTTILLALGIMLTARGTVGRRHPRETTGGVDWSAYGFSGSENGTSCDVSDGGSGADCGGGDGGGGGGSD